MLRVPGPVPQPQAAAMPAQLLHGALHGRPRRLCQATGEMSRMPCRTQDPVPGGTGVSHKRDASEVPGAPRQHSRRAAGPHGGASHGKMQRLLRKSILRSMRPLRQESLRGMQIKPHGSSTQGNLPNQQPNTSRRK